MKATYRLAAAAVLAALLSACGAGVGVSGGDGHVGARGSVDLSNGNSSVTPYGKVGVGGGGNALGSCVTDTVSVSANLGRLPENRLDGFR